MLPVLVKVTDCAVLLVCGNWSEKVREVDDKPATATKPVPLKVTFCGLLGAMSEIFSVAPRLPSAVGVNVTLTEQVPLAGSVAPVQVSSLVTKSLAFVPLTVALKMVTLATLLLLVTVTLCAVLLLLSGREGKVRLEVDKVTEVEVKLCTRFEAFTVPIPVAKSHPVAAPYAS
jgi:hypothetical protein